MKGNVQNDVPDWIVYPENLDEFVVINTLPTDSQLVLDWSADNDIELDFLGYWYKDQWCSAWRIPDSEHRTFFVLYWQLK